MLLKDEPIEATGLSETTIKAKLLKDPPELGLIKAKQGVKSGEMEENSWAFITRCYMPSDNTINDRMLKKLKIK